MDEGTKATKASWKAYATYAAVGAGALLGSYAVGRYMTPAKVEEKVVYQEIVQERVVIDTKILQEIQEQNREFREQLSELKETIHREKRTIRHPDGMVEITEVEDRNISKVVKEQEIKYVDREVKTVEIKYVDRAVEVEKKVESTKIVEASKPNWRVGVVAGVNLADPLKPSYGAIVERRILGPLSVGVLGMSNGQMAATLTLEF